MTKLRKFRHEAGLSLRELSRKVGCSHAFISQVERGLELMPAKYEVAWAEALGVSVDIIIAWNVQQRTTKRLAKVMKYVPEGKVAIVLPKEKVRWLARQGGVFCSPSELTEAAREGLEALEEGDEQV